MVGASTVCFVSFRVFALLVALDYSQRYEFRPGVYRRVVSPHECVSQAIVFFFREEMHGYSSDKGKYADPSDLRTAPRLLFFFGHMTTCVAQVLCGHRMLRWTLLTRLRPKARIRHVLFGTE